MAKIKAFPVFFKHKKLEQVVNIAYVFPHIKFQMEDTKMNNQAQKRQSRDDVWPLRNAEGLTFAEAKLRLSLSAGRKRTKPRASIN